MIDDGEDKFFDDDDYDFWFLIFDFDMIFWLVRRLSKT